MLIRGGLDRAYLLINFQTIDVIFGHNIPNDKDRISIRLLYHSFIQELTV